MNKLLRSITFIFILIFNHIYAQSYTGSEAKKINPNFKKVTLDSKDKTVKYIDFEKTVLFNESSFKDVLNNYFSLNPNFNYLKISDETDKLKIRHLKYQLTYNNIKIENCIVILHIKNNNEIYAINGKVVPNSIKIQSTSKIKKEESIKLAKKHISVNQKITWMKNHPFSVEEIFILSNNEIIKTYKVDVYAAEPLIRKYVYVNTLNGKIEKTIDRIHFTDVIGSAQTMYSGTKSITTNFNNNQYTLSESGRGNGINTLNLNNYVDYGIATDFLDQDNNWNNTTNNDHAATDAHFGSESVYDYYLNHFGRNSLDNQGAIINSYIHYGNAYNNAFWDGDKITYGDGDGTNYTPFTSLEIVGHELTHGITQHTSNLEYLNESGALNESFSDIFGVLIEYQYTPNIANYLIGDIIHTGHLGFRDMSNPNVFDDPDTYLGTYWHTDEAIDNGGVHTNSGVQNFWFYLLVNGGSGVNDLGNNYIINPISMENAAQIIYRSMSIYLTPTSQYADAREYSIQAAIDLYGECSPEVISVTNAWYAVGVGNPYSNVVIANFNSNSTASCSSPATFNFHNLSTNGTSFMWDFGDGNTSTAENPTHTYQNTGNFTVTLTVSGTGSCSSSNVIVKSNFINISNTPAPISVTCAPTTILPTNADGISRFRFNTIDNTTNFSSSELYQDFSCAKQTNVTAGNSYPVIINSGNNYAYLWIDYNNDGSFSESEKEYSSSTKKNVHAFDLIISGNTIYSTPLRVRIAASDQIISDNCVDLQKGQYEDYTVIISENALPPIANFSVGNQYTSIGIQNQFNDLSLHVPTSWTWYFENGTPAVSNLENPIVTYSSNGTYQVKLVVANSFGEDSITKTSYIHVIKNDFMCLNYNSTEENGRILDSGGESNNYNDMETCEFLIEPTSQQNIKLEILNFDSETNYDTLYIYDGTDVNGTLITALTGSIFQPNYYASSGKVFLYWKSDPFITKQGFDILWSTFSGNIGGINYNGNLLTNSVINFSSIETGMNNYNWNFGDGTSATGSETSSHTYSQSGIYIVTLTYNDLNNQLKTYNLTLNISSLGLSTIMTNNGIEYYPNPVESELIIKDNEKKQFSSYKIYTSTGKLVSNQNIGTYTSDFKIDLSTFNKGIYFVELKDNLNNLHRIKIVKEN